jgi:hypothetical protein
MSHTKRPRSPETAESSDSSSTTPRASPRNAAVTDGDGNAAAAGFTYLVTVRAQFASYDVGQYAHFELLDPAVCSLADAKRRCDEVFLAAMHATFRGLKRMWAHDLKYDVADLEADRIGDVPGLSDKMYALYEACDDCRVDSVAGPLCAMVIKMKPAVAGGLQVQTHGMGEDVLYCLPHPSGRRVDGRVADVSLLFA